MKFGIRLGHRNEVKVETKIEQKNELSLDQKIRVDQILSLRENLVYESPPEAKRGMEGILVSKEVLRSLKTHGILIGGLAESMWKKKTKEEDLAKHKDVDVLIVGTNWNDDKYPIFRKFEHGIDWWSPEGKYKNGVRCVNGKEVLLRFGVMFGNLPNGPGLYIPDPNWIVRMRIYELTSLYLSQHPENSVDDVYQELEKRLRDNIFANRFWYNDGSDNIYAYKEYGSEVLSHFNYNIIKDFDSRTRLPHVIELNDLESVDDKI